ncbi:M17 family metallopeptidase [Candidatus Mycoplasma mahonii]|uniref:M17 family metallopeptidase n=1 Tax=Candidatus Mycoplasma mahonii TaxID=3004105 RepID=UPI0026E9CBB1|nr:M17 family metallopeptidase [Candidatus Mycoplasma mahonii]WKX02334.1 M17 family metallopeptidase [Candidatus Mycoplasma mahonii]
MIKITNRVKNKFILKGVFASSKLNKNIIKQKNKVTEFIEKKEAIIYLGKEGDFNHEGMIAVAKAIASLNTRDFQISVKTFITKKITQKEIVNVFVLEQEFKNGKIYNVETAKKDPKATLELIDVDAIGKAEYKTAIIHAESMTYTRNFQMMPPNVLNSEVYAKMLKDDFSKIKNVTTKVLTKKQIIDLKMGLFLSVNIGSAFEPRVVIVEYKGAPASKDKTVLVGKGITYDSGGYNIKNSQNLLGMKFDMSGSAIVAGAMRSIAKLKPKKNISMVLMITDNMINSVASKPDDVYTAMNGKTVEINNTDAEGRLALADGLTYAAKKLKATRLVDVATLTGAVLVALGHTYTGVWSTSEKGWEDINVAAKEMNENIWRLPFHKDFIEFMSKSKVADLKNTALDGLGGSSTAAMFLKSFTEDVEYIHLDVAGTADKGHYPYGPMVRTLTKVAK